VDRHSLSDPRAPAGGARRSRLWRRLVSGSRACRARGAVAADVSGTDDRAGEPGGRRVGRRPPLTRVNQATGTSVTPEPERRDAPSVSVVIAVFNSEQTLPELVERLAAVRCDGAPLREIVLVDDGSRDGSWRVIMRLASSYPQVRGIA